MGNKASYDTQTAVYNKLQVSQLAVRDAAIYGALHQSMRALPFILVVWLCLLHSWKYHPVCCIRSAACFSLRLE